MATLLSTSYMPIITAEDGRRMAANPAELLAPFTDEEMKAPLEGYPERRPRVWGCLTVILCMGTDPGESGRSLWERACFFPDSQTGRKRKKELTKLNIFWLWKQAMIIINLVRGGGCAKGGYLAEPRPKVHPLSLSPPSPLTRDWVISLLIISVSRPAEEL